MKKVLILTGILCLLFSSVKIAKAEDAQIRKTCGTKAPSLEYELKFEQKVKAYVASKLNSSSRIEANYNLPVIVHIVYWDASQNISQAQVNSQIDVLNADYAGIGYNYNNTPTAFKPLIANTNITFCKAVKDPNNVVLTEAGIDRINAADFGFKKPGTGWSDTYIDNTIKPATTWNASKYLNIWVLPLGGGLLGYATFPGGATNVDGVVIGTTNFGTVGNVAYPYDKGRTATHEVGHWLNLLHISGDKECGNDYCADTPPQIGNANDGSGLSYGCPTFPFQVNGCGAGKSPNGEMFMNFMDYTNDACMSLFTIDQRTRMQTAMSAYSLRSALASSGTCITNPQAPIANFTSDKTTICSGGQVKFTDLSSNFPTSWQWTFSGGTPATSNQQIPTVTYTTTGNYTVKLKVMNAQGSNEITRTSYISVSSPPAMSLPFSEGFQGNLFPPSGWSLATTSGENWEQNADAGGFATSSQSMLYDNFNLDAGSSKDDIITPAINLNGANSPRIKFDIAYAAYSNNSVDTLEVLIADACLSTFKSIYKKGSSALAGNNSNTMNYFIPSANQWRRDSIFVPAAYLNKNVKFIFRNYGGYGNNIYIDNVNVYGSAIAPTASASFTTSDTVVCQGNSLTFTNTSIASTGSPDSVRWTIQGGLPSTSTSVSNITSTFNTVGNFTISLIAYKAGNASATFSKSIRVKPKPNVTVNSPNICSGQFATLQANGASTYTWSPNIGTGATVNTPPLTSNANYTVTGITMGCSNSASASVTIKPIPGNPILTLSNDTLNCNVVIAGATYEWYKGGILFTTTLSSILKVTSNGNYSVKVINNNCSSIQSADVNVVLTGIKNNKSEVQLSVVPNPNNGLFDIAISSFSVKNYKLRLFTISGQTILEEDWLVKNGKNSKSINLTGMDKGIYYLSIISEEGVATQSIIVQ